MSGTTPNRFTICRRAMRLLGTFASGEPIGATEMADAVEALNAMTKTWQAEGIHVWTETEGFLALTAGQTQYALGAGSPERYGTNLATNALAVDAGLGVTTIALAAPTTSIVIGDQLGVMTPTGLIWSSVTATSASTVAVTALTMAAPAGSAVVSYHPSSGGYRPLRILAARRFNAASSIIIPLTPMARLDYQAMPNRIQTGVVNSYFYDAQLGQGTLFFWQAPSFPVQDIITFTFMRELATWDEPSSAGDFPAEWISALAYNLAEEIAPEYDVPPARMQMIVAKAADLKATVSGFDREPESIVFGVSMEPGYR